MQYLCITSGHNFGSLAGIIAAQPQRVVIVATNDEDSLQRARGLERVVAARLTKVNIVRSVIAPISQLNDFEKILHEFEKVVARDLDKNEPVRANLTGGTKLFALAVSRLLKDQLTIDYVSHGAGFVETINWLTGHTTQQALPYIPIDWQMALYQGGRPPVAKAEPSPQIEALAWEMYLTLKDQGAALTQLRRAISDAMKQGQSHIVVNQAEQIEWMGRIEAVLPKFPWSQSARTLTFNNRNNAFGWFVGGWLEDALARACTQKGITNVLRGVTIQSAQNEDVREVDLAISQNGKMSFIEVKADLKPEQKKEVVRQIASLGPQMLGLANHYILLGPEFTHNHSTLLSSLTDTTRVHKVGLYTSIEALLSKLT